MGSAPSVPVHGHSPRAVQAFGAPSAPTLLCLVPFSLPGVCERTREALPREVFFQNKSHSAAGSHEITGAS